MVERRLYLLPVLITAALLLLSGCDFTTEKAGSEAIPSRLEMKETAKGIRSITCFKCHPYEKFSTIFPHDLHRKMGLHCTQCHIIRGHKEIGLNREACNKCHNLTIMDMKTSSMPVRFNHQGHTEMFGCSDCHPGLFPMKLNGKKILMDDIFKERYCGRCHNGETAFSSSECNRCHKG
ncbi:MAG: cytochrome c3 family protein [Nitrospirae bacterium]|nr:cytochrome c3 family protein [Nitrospirota bacterium]